jgi:hypothetical protein
VDCNDERVRLTAKPARSQSRRRIASRHGRVASPEASSSWRCSEGGYYLEPSLYLKPILTAIALQFLVSISTVGLGMRP